VPNPEHPIVERFLVLNKVAHEHRKLRTAVDIIEEQLDEVNSKQGVS
jgi:hypothetical protein